MCTSWWLTDGCNAVPSGGEFRSEGGREAWPCSDGECYKTAEAILAPVPSFRAERPLPRNSPFRVTNLSAPRGARKLAGVRLKFYSNNLEEVLHSLREKARRMGGNLVTDLRCEQGMLIHFVGKDGSYRPVGASISKRIIGCRGWVYRYLP